MMRALAEFVMSGRMQAMMVAASFALIGLLLPPVGYLSGAAIGVVTLRKGPHEGLIVALGAVLASGLLVLFLVGHAAPALGFAFGLWLPVWLLAMVWRTTVSLPMTLQAAAGVGAALVLLFHVLLPEPAVWWRGVLEGIRPAMEQAGMLANGPEVDAALDAVARLMTGMVAAALVLSLTVSLLIARWWQAMLYNPGGFRSEFHTLRLDKRFAVVLAVVLALAIAVPGPLGAIATDLAMIGVMVFLFQGLALAHGLAAAVNAHTAWLVVLYVVLAFAPPQAVVIIAATGFADTWVDFRGKLARPSDGG
jgi:hypothetical protein